MSAEIVRMVYLYEVGSPGEWNEDQEYIQPCWWGIRVSEVRFKTAIIWQSETSEEWATQKDPTVGNATVSHMGSHHALTPL